MTQPHVPRQELGMQRWILILEARGSLRAPTLRPRRDHLSIRKSTLCLKLIHSLKPIPCST